MPFSSPHITLREMLIGRSLRMYRSELERALDRGPLGHHLRPARHVRKALDGLGRRTLDASIAGVERKIGHRHLVARAALLLREPVVPDLEEAAHALPEDVHRG